MILTFADVITAEEQRAILDAVANAEFVDGRETAGAALAETKRNEQIKRGSAAVPAIADILLAALKRRPEFLSATYPRQLHSTLVSRYRPGMRYGAHVDQALMGDAPLWRTDLSLTLFLNPPEDYDGGELVLESGSSESRFKLPARAIVCYPTGQLHRVEPITRGERLVVVSWIQSHVREPATREILRDLAVACEALAGREELRPVWDRVNKTHTNLLRRWAE